MYDGLALFMKNTRKAAVFSLVLAWKERGCQYHQAVPRVPALCCCTRVLRHGMLLRRRLQL